jgi:hypothetical protein
MVGILIGIAPTSAPNGSRAMTEASGYHAA